MHVLIAEDDLGTRKMLQFIFEQHAGYTVAEADSASRVLQMLQEQPFDLLVTDVMLPDIDGLELIRRVRRTSSIPIMIVSARTDIPQRVKGLRVGADDYIPKPFDVSELLARVDALLRRVARTPRAVGDGRMAVGSLVLEPNVQAVELSGRGRVRLTPSEFRLLLQLAKTPNEVRPHEELEQAITGSSSGCAPGELHTYISNLRHKLEPDPSNPTLIETVRSRGYRLAV